MAAAGGHGKAAALVYRSAPQDRAADLMGRLESVATDPVLHSGACPIWAIGTREGLAKRWDSE